MRVEGETKIIILLFSILDLDNLKHRKDFEQEIQSLTRLDHPNIVRLLATYRDKQACKYFCMLAKIINAIILSILVSIAL